MSPMTAICFLVLSYAITLCQSQQFEILDITLPYNGTVNFCVDIFNDTLTTIYNLNQDDLKLCSAPFNYDHLDWTDKNEKNLPFNAKSIIYSGQVCIKYGNALYGVPRYIEYNDNNVELCDDQLFIFDIVSNQYRSPETYDSSLNIPTYQSCVAIAQNKLYIIGGTTEVTHWSHWTNVQIYDLTQDEFFPGSPLLIRRKAAGCAINKENSEQATNIYVFGGQSPYSTWLFDSIERYNIRSHVWIHVRWNMHYKRAFHTCSYIINNKIYCIGGWNEKYKFLKSVEIFDTQKEKILEQMIYLNIPRANHSAIIYNNHLLVLGGSTNIYEEHKITNSIEALFLYSGNPTLFPTFEPLNKTSSGNVVGWVFGIIATGVIILIIYFSYRHYSVCKLERQVSNMIDSEEKKDDIQQNLSAPLVKDIYHETQSWEFCLMHALNALLQRKQFTKTEMDNICNQLAPNKLINPHKSILQTGNYDANVLNMALHELNIDVEWFDSRKADEKIDLTNNEFLCPENEYKQFVGFILNDKYKKFKVFNRRHWLAIKKISNVWYDLDSKKSKPLKYETKLEIKQLEKWLINICKNHDGQLMICRRKKIK